MARHADYFLEPRNDRLWQTLKDMGDRQSLMRGLAIARINELKQEKAELGHELISANERNRLKDENIGRAFINVTCAMCHNPYPVDPDDQGFTDDGRPVNPTVMRCGRCEHNKQEETRPVGNGWH